MGVIQSKAFRKAEKGHNILITGPPGTGKTHLLGLIIDNLLFNDRSVAITSTTGISATVLRENLVQGHVKDLPPVTTIHRFCGLADGRHRNEELVNLLMTSERHLVYKENILRIQTLVIGKFSHNIAYFRQLYRCLVDEVSMLSCKLFEQVDHIFRAVRGNRRPFGGVQMILAGDFLQLPPVPTPEYGDDGSMIVSSPLLQYIHILNLTQIHRQTEIDLIQAIHEIARGELSQESECLIGRMKRPLPPGDPPVKLMSRRDDVEIFNARCLTEMEGDERIYRSIDEGNCARLTAEKELHLKIGCPVILTVNLTDYLVNGLRGTVDRMTDTEVIVDFKKCGKVTVHPHTFTQFDVNLQKDVGFRQQIPLTLGFATTIHKSQGMTLERLEIDCKGIFVYGQLAVAVSRAVSKKGLRIQNFRKSHVLPPPKTITDRFFSEQNSTFSESMTCCIENTVEISDTDTQFGSVEVTKEDSEDEIEDEEIIQIINSLEQEEDETPVDISHIDIPGLLHQLMYENPQTEIQQREDDLVKSLTENMPKVEKFIMFLYRRIIKVKEENIGTAEVSNKGVNLFYSKFGEVLSSPAYRNKVNELFEINPQDIHFNVAYKLAVKIRKLIIAQHVQPIKEEAKKMAEEKGRKEFPSSSSGKGKIRYIAGWCLFGLRKKVKRNMKSIMYNPKKVSTMEELISHNDLIEHLTATSETEIQKTSSMQDTLFETSRKQNIRKGLTHVTDECYEFFETLDKEVRGEETEENLQLHGKDFPVYQKSVIVKSESVKTKWTNLFSTLQTSEEVTSKLLIEVIEKYLRMSLSQLRKEYLSQQQTKKMEATRKQIKMRTEKSAEKIFNITTIRKDDSVDKQISHRRLQSEVLKSKTFLVKNFTKNDLNDLCTMYNIDTKPLKTKQAMSDAIASIVQNFDVMPNPSLSPTAISEDPRPGTSARGKKRKSTAEWPCGVCLQEADTDSVCCDSCDTWYHGLCIGIAELNSLPDKWYCHKCQKS